jgi:hypothetical protein
MLPRANWLRSIVLAAAVIGVPGQAGAQTGPADSATAPRIEASVDGTTQPFVETRVGSDVGGGHPEAMRAVTSAFLITASTDLAVSMYQIGRGEAREVGFGAPWQDSPVAFAVTKSAMAVGFAYGLQHLHKSRPKTALVLGMAATALETWLTVRGAQISTAPR